MTPPTPEELLRLARKAWPVGDAALTTTIRNLAGMLHKDEAVAHQALHAALLVLAGEADVAALLAERDFYRNEVIAYERAASFCPPQGRTEDP